MFLKYKVEDENQLNKKIKRLRSDRGGEYELKQVNEFCEHGIIHETTPPYSPESNGVAERKNRNTQKYDECYAYKFWCNSEPVEGGYTLCLSYSK